MRACIVCCSLVLHLALYVAMVSPSSAEQPQPVVFLHYWSDDFQGVDAMVASAKQVDPSLHVLVRPFEHESFKVSIQAMLHSDASPDVFSYWAGQRTQLLVDQGLIAPIDDVWETHQLATRFPPAIQAACTYNGTRYAVPLTQHWTGLFYNKNVFQALGLSPPATWEHFLQLCETLKQAGIAPIALGIQDRWPAQFWFDHLLLHTAGPDFRRRLVEGKASFLDPKVKHAAAVWQSLVDKGYFLRQPVLYDWAGAAKALHGGQAAMILGGTWLIGFLEGTLGWESGEDFDVFAFPTMDASLPRVNLGPIDMLALATRGKQQEGRQVMAAFASAASQLAMSKGSGALAPSVEVPVSAYSPVQQRIMDYIAQGDAWAFNFDLEFPKPVAQAGLAAFVAFQQGRIKADAMLQYIQDVADVAYTTQP